MDALSRFDDNDWEAFAGMELFRDGSDPLIGYSGQVYTVVIDGSGVTLFKWIESARENVVVGQIKKRL